MEDIDYEKLRLDVLQKMVDERNIICKSTKSEIIKHLKMDDNGKYINETTYEKYGKETFLCGIDMRNQKHLIDMGKLVEKKESIRYNMYTGNRVYFITKQKLI
jgi:hypothetical protein